VIQLDSKYLQNFDWILLLAVLALMGIGLLNLYSIEHLPSNLEGDFVFDRYDFLERQLVWVLAGLIIIVLAAAIPFKYYEASSYAFYLVGLGLLLAVLVFPSARGSKRWLELGGLRIQPSEFMKIATIFLLAKFLGAKARDPNRLKVMAASVAIAALPLFLVVKQPDLGTAIVFPALLLPVLYWRGLDEGIMLLFLTPVISAFLTIYSERSISGGSYPFTLLVFFVLILIIAYRRRERIIQSLLLVGVNLSVMLMVPGLISSLKPYQQKRVLAFLKPESDILGMGWQVYQSKVAIGSGGFTGKGFLKGTQKMLDFLPERHSDFVFSVLSEELGFLGSVLVVTLFAVMIYRILYIAVRSKSRFASIAAVGAASYFIFHAVINIGMTIGLAPVTGLPLPFISYGGSSMFTSCFLVGAVLGFGMRFYEY